MLSLPRASYEARQETCTKFQPTKKISTHAPHTRRDEKRARNSNQQRKFLLTRLIRGATRAAFKSAWNANYFYSRASYEARLNEYLYRMGGHDFYSRASYEARLIAIGFPKPTEENFYSRASYEARHKRNTFKVSELEISTHAPHTRRDKS